MSKPEHNGDARFSEAFSESNEEGQTKEGLERRLLEISRMRSDTQEEIIRLQSELEGMFRTAALLEAEEETIRQMLEQM